MVIIVHPDGRVTVVAHADLDADRLSALGEVEVVRRGGYVVPAHPLRRAAFRLVRRFGRSPRVVAWTRTWRGPWLVDLAPSGGPVLGPFPTRAEAVIAEEEWLAEQEERQGL